MTLFKGIKGLILLVLGTVLFIVATTQMSHQHGADCDHSPEVAFKAINEVEDTIPEYLTYHFEVDNPDMQVNGSVTIVLYLKDDRDGSSLFHARHCPCGSQ